MPILEDAWSHTFNMAEHLSTVHAHQGKNHLDAALADKASDMNADKNQKTIHLEEQYTSHICIPVYKFGFSYSKPNKHYSTAKLHKVVAVFILKQGPPPKTSQKPIFSIHNRYCAIDMVREKGR